MKIKTFDIRSFSEAFIRFSLFLFWLCNIKSFSNIEFQPDESIC